MGDQPQATVQTRIPTSTRKLPFLRRKSKNKDTRRQHDSPVSPVDSVEHRRPLQQQETWPDLNAAAVSPDREPTPQHEYHDSLNQQAQSSADDDNEYEQQTPEAKQMSTFPETAYEEGSYDLRPPPPVNTQSNMETLAGRLFSVEHLDNILSDHVTAARFSRFLDAYRPRYVHVLKKYADARKAVLAVEYANAVARQLQSGDERRSELAAALDRGFQSQINQETNGLISDALPAYITHRLTQLVTDHLVKEITQNSAPIMKELIPNLAEVYCITDVKVQDNPIVYASEEFYKVSQYGRDYVLGRNCRFLQGPKTSHSSVKRMIDAIEHGQEVCETLLNYRRDGTPFMNLLLIAPLYDNKGQLRYFLGCQIDVSPLIDRGRGLESFERLLAKEQAESRYAGALDKDPDYALAKFGAMLSEEETSSITSRTRAAGSTSEEPTKASRAPRRFIGMDEAGPEKQLWPHHSLGHSGRLPGVYQNYLLIRPYPSLRITFASPALRIPGLLQTKFLDRIGGPSHVRENILDAFAHGTGLTARITWLTQSLNSVGGYSPSQVDSHVRWIHCTPLLGSDERVGVWVVVIVENEEVTGALKRRMPPSEVATSVRSGEQASAGASVRERRKNLYAEYMRNDGRSRAGESDGLDLYGDNEEFPDF